MRALRPIMATVLILSGCRPADDDYLRNELRNESADIGLAIVEANARDILVIPFDSEEKYFQSEYGSPIAAFGKSGQMVLWWFPRDFLDLRGEFVIDFTNGQRVAKKQPGAAGFHPLALNETTRRIAFWSGSQDNKPEGLYWASFDLSRIGFVDQTKAYPDWSPDGGGLIYDKEGQIYLFDVLSNSSRSVISGHDPTLSPNGKWIAFVSMPRKRWKDDYREEVWLQIGGL